MFLMFFVLFKRSFFAFVHHGGQSMDSAVVANGAPSSSSSHHCHDQKSGLQMFE